MCKECGGKGKHHLHDHEPSHKPGTSKPLNPENIIGVMGNISGLTDKNSPVTDMKMYFQRKPKGPPELNIDINLKKQKGQDEEFFLTTEKTLQEKEREKEARLRKIEEDLEKVKQQLDFARRTRREWNAQKESLCNRRIKPHCT